MTVPANIKEIGLIAWAMLGVPVIFALYVFLSYQYSLSRGMLPYTLMPRSVWFVVFAGCLLSGIMSIFFVRSKKKATRVFIGIIYAPVMGALMLALHLWVACASGDCL